MNDRNEKNSKIKIITHSGRFHTDEVFSCAALSLVYNNAVEIVRSRDAEAKATADIVVDVGGEYDDTRARFDHHQKGGAGVRENGIPYSSFGLVWKHYGKELVSSPLAEKIIDERLVQPIDASDNGVDTFTLANTVAPYLIQDVISGFVPAWDERKTEDEAFFDALEIAKKILLRVIQNTESGIKGVLRVEEAYKNAEDKRIIVLDNQYPWSDILSSLAEPLYVVSPERGETGNWKVEAVRSARHSFQSRKYLPESWAGKQGEELAKVSGVSDAYFCHNNRFIAGARSKEGALALALLAVNA